jgi:hypothetical protein
MSDGETIIDLKPYEDKIEQVVKDCLDFIKLEYDKIEIHVELSQPPNFACKWMIRPKGTQGAIKASFAFTATDNLDDARAAIITAIGFATHPMGAVFQYVQQVYPMFTMEDSTRNDPAEVFLRAKIFQLYNATQHPDAKQVNPDFKFNRVNGAGILATALHVEENLTEFFKSKIAIARSMGQLRHLPKDR